MRLDISAVNRHDVEVSAWKTESWIEIQISNAVGIPTPVQLEPNKPLLLVIVPEKREGMSDTERRGRLLIEANRKVAQRYGIE